MLPVLSELFWALRRSGFTISTSEALDAGRAVGLLGLDDPVRLERALAATLLKHGSERARFRRVVEDHFSPHAGHAGDLFHRLRGRGFTAAQVDALAEVLFAAAERSGQGGDALVLSAAAGTGAELSWLLRGARIRRRLAGFHNPKMAGFYAEQAARALGLPALASALDRAQRVLRESWGEEVGTRLGDALREELAALRARVRDELLAEVARPRARHDGALGKELRALDAGEAARVRSAIRELGHKLGGKRRARQRRARRGRVDPGRTMRAALVTGGVPFRLLRRRAREQRPKLVVLCDVSDSVRAASRFLLELVAAASASWESTRSFVFVAELCDTTELFRGGRSDRALEVIGSGALLNLGAATRYGRAFGEARRRLAGKLDKRTTLVILGDGRTADDELAQRELAAMRESVRSVIWICPEARGSWGEGDSRMPKFERLASRVLVAETGAELVAAARALVRVA